MTERDEPGNVVPTFGGRVEGFELMVAERGVKLLNRHQRAALGRFMTLMFMRSPMVHRSIEAIAADYRSIMEDCMVRAGLPRAARDQSHREVETAFGNPADRALRLVGDTRGFLSSLHWWVLRAGQDECFVLGDSPTVAAVALGHADAYLPLLGSSTFVVAMPLHPEVALVATQLPVIPLSGDGQDLVGAVNRLTWIWAEEHIVAGDAGYLRALSEALGEQAQQRRISVPYDREALRTQVASDVASVMARLGWRPYRDVCPPSGVAGASLANYIRRTGRLPDPDDPVELIP